MAAMFQDKYVFSQLTAFLNRTQFNNYVRKYDGNRYVKHFTCWNQMLAMMFGQLSNRESLRDLIVAFEAHRAKQYHLGLGREPIAKTTLATANQNRDYRIFEDFAFYMMKEACEKRTTNILDISGKKYAFDSTTIPLCLATFPWAKFRSKKGGVKAHVLYDIEAQVPAFYTVTTASKHDSTAMSSIHYEPNAYYKKVSFDFVKESETFTPLSMQDIKDIFYSILDRGYDEFTFYCPSEYTSCLDDVNAITNDAGVLTHINNFVSPFNNFKSINVTYSQSGEVNIKIEKLYSSDDIVTINSKINEIISENITDDMKLEDKILKIHDYIINTTKYDTDNSDSKSSTAYGALINHKAVCGGYADAMALFLNKFNVPNFKIASNTHVWNAVYIDSAWLHLDLTWDDPVSSSGEDTILHKFYLIDTPSLEKYKITDHEYDKTIYEELS